MSAPCEQRKNRAREYVGVILHESFKYDECCFWLDKMQHTSFSCAIPKMVAKKKIAASLNAHCASGNISCLLPQLTESVVVSFTQFCAMITNTTNYTLLMVYHSTAAAPDICNHIKAGFGALCAKLMRTHALLK